MTINRIRLTESQLHNIIKESVKKVLKEAKRYPEPTEDEFNEYDTAFDSYDEYNNMVDYDDDFRLQMLPGGGMQTKSITAPRSYEKYKNRIPKTPSDSVKKHEMNRDWERLGKKHPSVDDIFRGEDAMNKHKDDNGEYFKRHYVDDDLTRNTDLNHASFVLWKNSDERRREKIANRRKNQQDYSIANKKPLHRKGSLNREL